MTFYYVTGKRCISAAFFYIQKGVVRDFAFGILGLKVNLNFACIDLRN